MLKKDSRNSKKFFHFCVDYHYGVLENMLVTVLVNWRGREYVYFDILVSRSGIEQEKRIGQSVLNEEECLKDKNPGGK